MNRPHTLLAILLLAVLAVRIVGRRRLLRLFQFPGLIAVPVTFFLAAVTDATFLRWSIFCVGICTVGQFSFWGNYLPRVFPTHLRGTGESFAANIGGRMIGTSAAVMTTQLANAMGSGSPASRLAVAAGIVATAGRDELSHFRVAGGSGLSRTAVRARYPEEVDIATGKVNILRYTAIQDVGTAIHPSYVEGQIQGGAAQGIGMALTEESFYDDSGVMRNSSLLDYRMPTTLDLPMLETILVEVPNPGHQIGRAHV